MKHTQRLFLTFTYISIIINVTLIINLINLFESFIQITPIIYTKLIEYSLIIFLTLFTGKIIPRHIAIKRVENYILNTSFVIYIFYYLLYPLNSLFIQLSKLLVVKNKNQKPIYNLSQIFETTQHKIVDDKKILKGILRFGTTESREIMSSRIDIVAVNKNENLKSVIHIISENKFSRLPIYESSLDQIIGIIYSKDFIPLLKKPIEYDWKHLIREPYFVPETKKIDDLLSDFQIKKIHLAIVIDEFGGTAGIVTLEDILEEIVGEINDNPQKQNTSNFIKIDDENYIFEGKTLLNDFYRILDYPDTLFKEEKGDADTLAGLILEITGEIPMKNAVLTCKKFEFRIIQSDNRRIKKIKITLPSIK